MGAPWTYGISDVRNLSDKAAATILDNVKVADLHPAYWPAKPRDSPIYHITPFARCRLSSSDEENARQEAYFSPDPKPRVFT